MYHTQCVCFRRLCNSARCIRIRHNSLLPLSVLVLSATFVLQKSLELKSDKLYAKAHPFALQSIKAWVGALFLTVNTNADIENEKDGKIRTADSFDSSEFRPRTRHPWELDAGELVLGDVIGVGSQGKVFRGRYKNNDVAVKTLFNIWPHNEIAESTYAETAAEAEALSQMRHRNIIQFY